jgi:hypothetical protein
MHSSVECSTNIQVVYNMLAEVEKADLNVDPCELRS